MENWTLDVRAGSISAGLDVITDVETPAATHRRQGAPASILLFILLNVVGLSLLATRPAAAQDGPLPNDANAYAPWVSPSSTNTHRPAFQEGVQAVDTPNIDDEIVFIDDQGYINVFDPFAPADLPPLVFSSPDGGWYDAIVADVNNDGDDEIIAFASNGLLKIYDPVIDADALQAGQGLGGVSWEELFVTQLPNQPLLLASGNFDDNPQTREIVVVFEEPGRPTESRIQILAQPAPPYDGRIWQPLTDVRLRATATDIATGELDGDGRDEIAIVSRGSGRLSVFRREANNVLREFWFAASQQRPWAGAAIGDVDAGTALPELVTVRNAAPPFASLVVHRYRPVDAFVDVLLREHLPAPRRVFVADVTGAGLPQIFMLRDVPSTDTRPRLFNSRTGSGTAFTFEVRLDSDNGYRAAAAGDIDGDGKDEIALVRDTGILIFREPGSSTTLTQTLTTPTNARTLALGNLDALGRDLLSASQLQIFRVPAGQAAQPQSVIVQNRTRADRPIPFEVGVAPAVRFVDAAPTSASTPASVIVTVDATDLLPIAMLSAEERRMLPVVEDETAAGYGANLVFAAANPLVLNSPLTIPVFIEVTPGVVMRPNRVDVILGATQLSPDCQASLPLTVEVAVLGTVSSTFAVNVTGSVVAEATAAATPHADIEWPSSVSWLTVTSPGNMTPSTLRLVVKPGGAYAPPGATAEIVLTATVPGATQNPLTRRIPVRVTCFPALLHLPLIQR